MIAAGTWGELTQKPGLALCTRGPGPRRGRERDRPGTPRPPARGDRGGRRRLHPPAPAARSRRAGGSGREGHGDGCRRRRGARAAPPVGPGPARRRRAAAAAGRAAGRTRAGAGGAPRGAPPGGPRRGRRTRRRAGPPAVRARHGVPVLTTYKAKGAIPESWPNAAGILTGGTIEAPLLHDADLIVGGRPRSGRADSRPVALSGAARVAEPVAAPAGRCRGVVLRRAADRLLEPGSGSMHPASRGRAAPIGPTRWRSSRRPTMARADAARRRRAVGRALGGGAIATVDAGAHMLVAMPALGSRSRAAVSSRAGWRRWGSACRRRSPHRS